MKILEVVDLAKYYAAGRLSLSRPRGSSGAVKALDGVSLHLGRGEAVGLVGESGSGKTTLVRCVLRLEEPTRGRVLFRGEDITRLSHSRLRRKRRYFQPVFQDPYSSLNPGMKIGEVVGEPLRIHRLGSAEQRRTRVAAILEQVGLGPDVVDRYPHAFSGGQRQRIAIARALAPEPELLIADEPVSALDVSVQGQILDLLADLKARLGLTLLFVSHSLPVVRRLCDRVAVILRGRLVESAPTKQLFQDPLHPYTRRLLAATPLSGRPRNAAGRWDGRLSIGELGEVKPGHWVAGE